LHRGDFPRAVGVLERGLHLGRTWQFVDITPDVAASLGYAYALVDRAEESLELVGDAVKAFRSRQGHVSPGIIVLCAGMAYLWAGRTAEATNCARELLAFTRRLGDRGGEAYALILTADIAAASGTENAEDYYREALALAESLGLRPRVALCHFGLGKLHRRRGNCEQAQEHLMTAVAMYREMGMTYLLEQAEAELRQLG
jgi:tetratricopeptide (TPR) repeat protein